MAASSLLVLLVCFFAVAAGSFLLLPMVVPPDFTVDEWLSLRVLAWLIDLGAHEAEDG